MIEEFQYVIPFIYFYLELMYRTRANITRGLYIFYPIFHCGLYWRMDYKSDNLCAKNKNSSFFKPKICGLYTRAVTDQERVIVVRVRYVVSALSFL